MVRGRHRGDELGRPAGFDPELSTAKPCINITGGIAFDFWLTVNTSLVVFPVLDEALVEDGPCGSAESVSY